MPIKDKEKLKEYRKIYHKQWVEKNRIKVRNYTNNWKKAKRLKEALEVKLLVET